MDGGLKGKVRKGEMELQFYAQKYFLIRNFLQFHLTLPYLTSNIIYKLIRWILIQ